MLIIRGVNVFPSQIEELILGQPQLSPHYLLEVGRDGHLDQLTVRVECHPDIAGEAAVRDRAGRDLQQRIKSFIGVTALVAIGNPGTIARSIGKATRVVDRRRA